MDSKPLPTKPRWCSSALSTSALKSTLYRSTILLPSPLLHLIKPTTGGNDPSHSSTAYLDGIRGLAAIVVYIEHFSAPFQPGLIGDHSREHDSWSVFQYPILRLIYNGSFGVSLFFVISGFALSRKPLLILVRGTPPRGGAGAGEDAQAQVQAQAHAQAWQTLSSASFRRGVRIFLPSLTIILFMLFGTRIYLFNRAWSLLPSTLTRRYNISPPKRLDSFPAQVLDCATFIAAQIVYPAQWMAEIPHTESGVYGFHLWTMPIEFWASQIVFGVLFALVPGTRAVRDVVAFWVLCFAFWCDRWEISLFLAGVLLADLEVNGNFDLGLDSDVESDSFKLPYHDHDHDHGNDNDNQHQNKRKSHTCARIPRRLLLKITTTVLFILGLYIGSTPEMNPHYTPGFKTLWGVIPSTEFWQSLGAVLVILSISLNPTLQKPFSHSLAQYLGKISFGVYLVHVPLLCWFGWAVVPWLWGWTGLDSDFRYECAVVGGAILVLGVVLWVADLFWRAVDSRCIRLGRGLERWLLQGGYREVFKFG